MRMYTVLMAILGIFGLASSKLLSFCKIRTNGDIPTSNYWAVLGLRQFQFALRHFGQLTKTESSPDDDTSILCVLTIPHFHRSSGTWIGRTEVSTASPCIALFPLQPKQPKLQLAFKPSNFSRLT